jgi:hypothetical protein
MKGHGDGLSVSIRQKKQIRKDKQVKISEIHRLFFIANNRFSE